MTSAWCSTKKALGVSLGVAECFVFMPTFYPPGDTLSALSWNISRQSRNQIWTALDPRPEFQIPLLGCPDLVAALPRWEIRGRFQLWDVRNLDSHNLPARSSNHFSL